MRRLFLVMILLAIGIGAMAQSQRDSAQLRSMLFNHFIEGAVLMKSGSVERAAMNYNTDDQSIVFVNNGKYLTLTGLEDVDTIYIDDKKFIPIKAVIYEIVTPSLEIPLLVSYSNKIRPVLATVDHNGGSRQQSAQVSNTLSDSYLSRTYKGNYSVEFIRHFVLRKRYTLYKAANEKQIAKAFPQNEEAIEKYIAENQTNFSSLPDMIDLITFCNEQNKKAVGN